MKLLKTLLLLGACTLFSLSGAVLKKGLSPQYEIVYADKAPSAHLQYYIKQAAVDLQTLLNKAIGVKLAIRPESEYTGKGRAIYIGNTQAAAKAGILPKACAHWEHHIRIINGNVFLFGADVQSKVYTKYKNLRRMELGSYKAMIAFMERFAGAVFAGAPKLADSVLYQKEIQIPDNFNFECKPFFVYNIGRNRDLPCDMGANGFYCPWYGSYGGHNHPRAVPMDKLFKEHPEYFALQRGKRDPGKQNQLCLSNPDVQKLIYQEVLSHIDQGYDMVQLAQSDGFCPCECGKCRDLYGIKPAADPKDRTAFRNDPAWGEKIWIMHKSFADRLLKDRPGKKVCIIAYGPTRRPPQSFKEFPDNVMIELAPFNDEVVQSWKGYKVPSGFVVYLYNWGYYKREGLMPKMSWEACRKQIQAFYDNNIRGIYRCGHGELFGTEGITYYIWGQLLQDPKLDIGKAVTKYCRVTFPGAEKEMEQFYRLLDQRLSITVDYKEPDWNDTDLLNRKKVLNKPTWEISLKRYPEDVIAKLESLLSQAESKLDNSRSWMLRLVRLEFNYMKYTARAINAMNDFKKTLSAADWQKAQEQLVLRQKLIDALPFQGSSGAMRDKMPLFGGISREMMLDGGRLSAPLSSPFTWNNCWYAEHKVQPAGRVMKINDTKPQYFVPTTAWNVVPDELYTKKAVKAFCKLDGTHLKAVFILENETYAAAKNYQLQLIFQAPGKPLYFYPGRFNSGFNRGYKQKKSNLENEGKGIVWESFSKPQIKRTVPAPGVTLKENEISAELDIDLKALNCVPKKGEEWKLNLIFSSTKAKMIWEHNFEQRSWRNSGDHQGKLLF